MSIPSLPTLAKNLPLAHPYNGQVPCIVNNSTDYGFGSQTQSSLSANYNSSRMVNSVNAASKNVAVKSFPGAVDNNNVFPPILNGSLPPLNVPVPSSITNFGKGIFLMSQILRMQLTLLILIMRFIIPLIF